MFKKIVLPTLLMLIVVSGGYAQEATAPRDFGDIDPPTRWLVTGRGKASALEQAWHKAKSDEQKEAVREKASEYLDRQFEADMKRREKELEAIEARVEKLRGQLERRIEKKDDIIGLQLKQMTMSWEGLGWSEPVEHNNFAVAWSPQPPMPPNAPIAGPPNNWSVGFGSPGSESNDLLKDIATAANEGDIDELRSLATKVAEQADEMDSGMANVLVWDIYSKFGDKVDDKKFWLTLAKVAEEAADGVDEPVAFGNILDTSARCYYLGGDIEMAVELQAKAAEASADGHDGEPDGEIAGFLKKLKKLSKEKDN